MIQEFSVRNFRSFKDEATLSFEATKDTTFEDTQVVTVAPQVRLLRFAVIYGPNASGKSNLLLALDFLRRFWFHNPKTMDDAIDVDPFLLDAHTPTEPSVFKLVFFVSETKYKYELALDQHVVYREELSYYKTHQPTLLLERGLEQGQSTLKLHSSLKVSRAVLEALTVKCLPNMSFFAARKKVNCTLALVDAARDWMQNGGMPVIEPDTEMFEYANRKLLEDVALKDYLLRFIRRADFNITEIEMRKEEAQWIDSIKNLVNGADELPQALRDAFSSDKKIYQIHTDFEHTVVDDRGEPQHYMLPENLQSRGTSRAFGVEAGIYTAIKKQCFLPVDEIDSSLHPEIVAFVIERFLQEKGRSQLLVTTHYDPLLSRVDDLFRKDSVWFTEKEANGNSSLYALVEFKGLNKIRSLQHAYRNGRFGALPNIY